MKDVFSILLLWPFAAVYGIVVWLRTELYRTGWLKSHSAGVPVISIGNITAGGTGKTPMAIYVAQILMNSGVLVAVLSRGYKRKAESGKRKTKTLVVSDGVSIKCSVEEAGDEPHLIAKRLLHSDEKCRTHNTECKTIPGTIVIVGKDRAASAKKAVALGAQAIILDDGFQHWRLARDLDIVLLDSERPFGNGWALPAGRLREPKSALRRASAVVLTRCTSEGIQNTEVGILNEGKPAFYTRHIVTGLTRWPSDESSNPAGLKGKCTLLFSGIARPELFERSIKGLGLDFSGHIAFGDHHNFDGADLDRIATAAKSCEAVITTEKDAVRLPASWDPGKPVYILRIGIEFVKDADTFEQLILSTVRKTA